MTSERWLGGVFALAAAAIVVVLASAVMAPLIEGQRRSIEPSITVWVFAHPDDETLAAAGAMVTEREGGDHIVVILSDGTATRAAERLELSPVELAAARRSEVMAALDVIGLDDVRFTGLPDRGVETDDVIDAVRPVLAQADGPVAVRGHSPLDSYSEGACGHVDHCAAGRALLELHDEGIIDDLRLYRLGHLLDGPRGGYCQQLSDAQMALKQSMRAEYELVDPAAGRYGIGGLSVPGAWEAAEVEPECVEGPISVHVGQAVLPLVAGLLAIASVAAVVGWRTRRTPTGSRLRGGS